MNEYEEGYQKFIDSILNFVRFSYDSMRDRQDHFDHAQELVDPSRTRPPGEAFVSLISGSRRRHPHLHHPRRPCRRPPVALAERTRMTVTATMSAAELREQQVRAIGCWQQLGHVMYVPSELSIADHLAEGPRSVEDLAAATDSNAPALRRVLRCAAAAGIFADREDGAFEATPLSAGLRSANVGGLRPIAQFANSSAGRSA